MRTQRGELKDLVLKKLGRRRTWRKKRYTLDDIKRMGWKRHERKLVERAVLELIKEGKLRWYNKSKKAIQLAF